MGINDTLRDEAVRHAVYLSRYQAGVVKQVLTALAKADRDLIRQIRSANVSAEITQRRLERQLERVRELMHEQYMVYRKALRGELRQAAKYEIGFQQARLDRALAVIDLGATVPAAPAVYTLVLARPFQGKYLREWTAGLEAESYARVRDAIRTGVLEGETVSQLVTRLRGTKAAGYRDGILALNRRNAEGIVRTAVNHTVSTARNEFYRANKSLIKGVQYVATLDSRTTQTCGALDGRVFPIDSGPRPPQHFNCRSSTTPVIKSLAELGVKGNIPQATRASLDGQVPATKTYQTWLREQPAGVQNDILGRGKARLFREGGVKLDRFVDANGRPYTLAELAKREATAFEKIGGP